MLRASTRFAPVMASRSAQTKFSFFSFETRAAAPFPSVFIDFSPNFSRFRFSRMFDTPNYLFSTTCHIRFGPLPWEQTENRIPEISQFHSSLFSQFVFRFRLVLFPNLSKMFDSKKLFADNVGLRKIRRRFPVCRTTAARRRSANARCAFRFPFKVSICILIETNSNMEYFQKN